MALLHIWLKYQTVISANEKSKVIFTKVDIKPRSYSGSKSDILIDLLWTRFSVVIIFNLKMAFIIAKNNSFIPSLLICFLTLNRGVMSNL